MPLDELFEWYRYHAEQFDDQAAPVPGAKPAVEARSVDEEIAMLKAAMGG